jgi:hypothetical protein
MTEAGMDDPRVFWINVTNIVLGVIVLVLAIITVLAVAVEFVAGAKRKLKRDAELRHPFRYLK